MYFIADDKMIFNFLSELYDALNLQCRQIQLMAEYFHLFFQSFWFLFVVKSINKEQFWSKYPTLEY